jgi:glyoxylase-like metal-dependent hydrolase (beta-lactamase superfamily II)
VKVINGIHRIEIRFVNVYLIINDTLKLIDAGLPGSGDTIINYIKSIGYDPNSLTGIFITHHHYDHTGSLKELIEKTNAKVYAHTDEKEYIERETGISADYILKDGDIINDLKIIHTPGHTPGHICLLHLGTGSLFSGDLFYEDNGQLYEIPHRYSMDPEMNRSSIKKLLNIDFKHIMPSHGKPIIGKGKEALEDLIRRLGI